VVEIMLENHTFDDLFGYLRGADGIPVGTTLPNPNESYDSAPPVTPIVAGPNQGSVGPELDNGRRAELMAMDRQPDGKFAMDDYTQFPYDGLASITTFSPSADPNLQYLAAHYALAEENFQPEIAPTQPNVTAAVNGDSGGWYFNNNPPATVQFHTIFDQLQAADRSWKIYYGVPPSMLAGSIWDRYMPAGHADGLVGTDQFIAAAAAGTLPDFCLVRPGVGYSEESPEDLSQGDAWLGQLVRAVMTGPDWSSSAVFITYDEGGGFWDHVSPPQVDASGYGTRTPMVVISPYVRRGLITQTTTNLSVLSFAQRLWGLPALDGVNARAPDLFEWFNFGQAPQAPHLPPVAPPDTLRMAEGSGYTLSYTANPRAAVTVNLVAEDPALDQDSDLHGRVSLRAIGPPGAPAASVPASVPMTRGLASFRARFPTAGYWRLESAGPDGSRGWVTIAVATGAGTP
jgi:phospholipase C